MTDMFRRFFQPEFLFLLGALQALLPYPFWLTSGTDLNYLFYLSSTPTLIYILGFFCFLIGCSCATVPRVDQPFEYLEHFPERRLNLVTVFLSAFLCLQIVMIARVYGTVPLLNFLSGQGDINDANESLEDSSLGQMALLQVSLLMLTALVLMTVLKRVRAGRFRWLDPSLLIPLAIMAFGFTMGGKRQGLVMAMFFLGTGICLHSTKAIHRILDSLMIRGRGMRTLMYVGGPVLGILLFQYLGMARSGRDASLGFRETLVYLELPLINLEYQTELVGWGPNRFEPAGLFRHLLPRRFHLVASPNLLNMELAPRLEPTASAGFYGDLHWHTGVAGIMLFPFLAGMLSKYCCARAARNPWALLCYCQFSWTLLSCHSYNHFINLVFIPLPVASYLMLVLILAPRRASKNGSLTSRSALQPHFQLQSSRARPLGRVPGVTGRGR